MDKKIITVELSSSAITYNKNNIWHSTNIKYRLWKNRKNRIVFVVGASYYSWYWYHLLAGVLLSRQYLLK
jgi:hypothetical protein